MWLGKSMAEANLTPFIPLSFEGEGEELKKRDKAPLKRPLDKPLYCKGLLLTSGW
jgi:hypothetical protein